MNGNEQLHANIKEQQIKHRYKNKDIDAHLKVAEGTYNTKMSRLKAGSKHSITVSDFKGLMALFGCTCAALFKNVDFSKDQK